jgi:predicted RND superfamily exporter protein
MIITELRDNLLTSLLCIFLCCNLLLLHPFAALALTLMVAIAEAMLLAYMATAGVALNSVTLAICVMSVGLIVDYCAHIMHQFMLEQGTSSGE